MLKMYKVSIVVAFLAVVVSMVAASSCSSNADCPVDQCCGSRQLDVLSLDKSCQPYAQEGQPCHGSLIFANCDCMEGLECVEHTGFLSFLHTEKGICRKPGDADQGLLSSIFG